METGWDLGTGQYSEASDNCALLWAEKPNRARPSWIVNRSKPVLSVAMSAATTGGNKIHGRKRHLLVDTQGLLIRVKVLAANITDRDGVAILLTSLLWHLPRLQVDLSGRVATIVISNQWKLHQQDSSWPCCYATLNTFIRLLCALGIVCKVPRRKNCAATYHLPLADY